MKYMIYFLFVTKVVSEEVTTPANFLGPRHFNHHAFDAEQYLKSLNLPVPTQKGPVLFPKDAPPPPRPPLVVTSRPLIESIARSNLNPQPVNNSVAESSNNGVSFVPYLGRVRDYESNRPYYVTDRYYETQTALPVYNLASQTRTIPNPEQRLVNYEYQIKEPVYTHQRSNEVHDENSADYGNYAFSYAVKDKNTGDDFSHSQRSSGTGTNGEYRVRLPDGRMQIVSYTADENGYKADVRYDGEANVNADNNINLHNVDYDTNKLNYVDDKLDNHITADKYNNKDYNTNIYGNQQPKDKQDYYNNYDSKEYYNDYSSEYNENYLPHTNKFANLIKPVQNVPVVSTVKPSYEEIKDLFTPNKFYNGNTEVTTSNYKDLVGTTENVVLISSRPNLYTNINAIRSTSTPIIATTPRSYLVSTIASLKNKLNLNQPVLSNRFIDKINKYLNFN